MNICAISPHTKTPKSRILQLLHEVKTDLVLLPGFSSNMPTPAEVQSVIDSQKAAFVETLGKESEATPCFVTSQAVRPMPQQIFGRKPTAKHIDALIRILPDRTFSVAARSVTFLICGELLAFNPDGSIKHGRKLSLDILANPAHTLMGHWNYLDRKLKSLSNGSVAMYATNNDRNHDRITTDVRIYRNCKLVPERNTLDGLSWSQCEI
jgi:hypothetical protein